MLTDRQQEIFDEFRESTHANEYLSERDELLAGLAAAMALDCTPCVRYYALKAKAAGIEQGAISEVLAKVMVVSANKKRLQTGEILGRYFEPAPADEVA